MLFPHFATYLVELFEGRELVVYLDSSGNPTVGVGHLVRPGDHLQVGDRITPEHCDELLEQDLAGAWHMVSKLIWPAIGLGNTRAAVLVSIAYNCPAALAPGAELRQVVDQRDLDDIPNAIRLYDKARNPVTKLLEVNAGLVKRRHVESVLWELPQILSWLRDDPGGIGPPQPNLWVQGLQSLLLVAGYDPGAVDGRLGPHTTSMLRALQRVAGLAATGIVDIATADALQAALESRGAR